MKNLTRNFTSLAYIKTQPPFELKLRFLLSLKACTTKKDQLLLIQKFLATRLSINDELSWKHHFLGSIFNGKVNYKDLTHFPNIVYPSSGTIQIANLVELEVAKKINQQFATMVHLCDSKEILNQTSQLITCNQKNPDYKINGIYHDCKLTTYKQTKFNYISHTYSTNGEANNIYNNNYNISTYNLNQTLFCNSVLTEIDNYHISNSTKIQIKTLLSENIYLLSQNKPDFQKPININWLKLKTLLQAENVSFSQSILIFDETPPAKSLEFLKEQKLNTSLRQIFEDYQNQKNLTNLYNKALMHCIGEDSQKWLEKIKNMSFTNLENIIN